MYSEAVMKTAVAHCSALTGISSDVITAIANCTRPLFDYDEDDDDSSVDRLIIDIKDEDAETVSDDLQSIASSVDNGICDNFDQDSLLQVELITCESVKEDISETFDTENCDEVSDPCSQTQSIDDKLLIDTEKVNMEWSTNEVEIIKSPHMLTDRMFMYWPVASCRVGAGLQNLGNTCFVNATVQCLTYTVPLVNYLLTLNHSTSCKFHLVVLSFL